MTRKTKAEMLAESMQRFELEQLRLGHADLKLRILAALSAQSATTGLVPQALKLMQELKTQAGQ